MAACFTASLAIYLYAAHLCRASSCINIHSKPSWWSRKIMFCIFCCFCFLNAVRLHILLTVCVRGCRCFEWHDLSQQRLNTTTEIMSCTDWIKIQLHSHSSEHEAVCIQRHVGTFLYNYRLLKPCNICSRLLSNYLSTAVMTSHSESLGWAVNSYGSIKQSRDAQNSACSQNSADLENTINFQDSMIILKICSWIRNVKEYNELSLLLIACGIHKYMRLTIL